MRGNCGAVWIRFRPSGQITTSRRDEDVTNFEAQTPPPPPAGTPPPGAPPSGNGIAVAALVLGIVAIPTVCFWYISIPCAVLGIIFGVVGRNAATKGAPRGGMATAGLVCGLIALILFVLAIAGCLAFLGITGLTAAELAEELQQVAEEAQRAAETMPTAPPESP